MIISFGVSTVNYLSNMYLFHKRLNSLINMMAVVSDLLEDLLQYVFINCVEMRRLLLFKLTKSTLDRAVDGSPSQIPSLSQIGY